MAENKETMKCPVCGTANPAGSAFCNDCGALLDPAKKKQMRAQGEGQGKGSKKKSSSGLSPVKTAGIALGVLLVVALVILIASGVFDSPKAGDPHAGHNHAPGEGHGQTNPMAGGNMQIDPQILDMEKQLAATPDNLDLTLNLAHKYFDTGMFEKAVPLYKKYLEKKPTEPDVITDLGVCYFNMQDLKNAEENFKKAIGINPKHQIAHLNMGVIKLTENKTDEATEWLNKAIAIDPGSNAAGQAKNILEKNKNK